MGTPVYDDLCFDVIGEGLTFYTGHDLARSVDLCGHVNKRYRNICLRAAINEAATSPSTFDIESGDHTPAELKSLCTRIPGLIDDN